MSKFTGFIVGAFMGAMTLPAYVAVETFIEKESCRKLMLGNKNLSVRSAWKSLYDSSLSTQDRQYTVTRPVVVRRQYNVVVGMTGSDVSVTESRSSRDEVYEYMGTETSYPLTAGLVLAGGLIGLCAESVDREKQKQLSVMQNQKQK